MLSLLISLMAQSISVPVVVGDFQVTNQFEVASHLRKEIVYTSNQAGQDRVRQLQKENYTCVVKANPRTECSKILHGEDNQTLLNQYVNEKLKGLSFSFSKNAGDPALVNDAEAVQEYQVTQKVTVWEVPFQTPKAQWKSLIYLTNGTYWKFQLGKYPEDSYYAFLVQENAQPVLTQEVTFENGLIKDSYFLWLSLERVMP